jgi:fatty acid desaturase
MQLYINEIQELKLIFKNKNLYKTSNKKAWIHILIRILVQILLLCLSLFFFDNIILFILFSAFYFFCYSFMGMAGISHELLHNNVFQSKKMNNFFYKIFMILTFNNYGYFEYTHWQHHKVTLEDNDPKDLFTGNMTIKQLILWLSVDLPSLFNRIKILYKNSIGKMPSSIPAIKKHRIIKAARVVLFFHLFTFVLFLILKLYFLIVFINLAPFIFTIFNKILAINQHYNLDNKYSDCDDYVLNTRTILLSNFLSFFYANMNYHIEHHYFPAIPFYNLPKVQILVYQKLNYSNLESGMLNSFRRLFSNNYK